MIPLLKPSCTQAEIDAVTEVLESGWWGQGPKCEEFEKRIAKLHGYKYAVTTNSATAALHLALKAIGIGPGDEVIVPALTFISTALAVTYCGAKPVFADVKPDTLTMDWEDADSKISLFTKAFIPVDYAGYPAGHMIYGRLADTYFGMPVIQDAAHSCGGLAYGDLVCFSFHPVKNLATGDGGCVLTNNEEQYEHLKALRWCGINHSTYDRLQKHYNWDYDIKEIGYKYHWNDIQAAIGLAQLDRLESLLGWRQHIADVYTCELQKCCETPARHSRHTNHLYPIRVDVEKRDKILDYLLAEGISVGVHYKPLTHYPMYSDQPTPPVTEREWKRLISLPIFYDLTDRQVDFIIDKVKEAISIC